MIPLSVPSIHGNEWVYVKECLDTGWVSSAGAFVDRFERDISNYTGARYAIACVNGTTALHVSCLLVGVKPGDEVIVPTATFIAPVNAVIYCNATPIFFDCDEYYNIDAAKTVEYLERETVQRNGVAVDRRTGRRIGAVVVVHVFGNAVDLQPILEACAERGVPVVEDATESLGTTYTSGPLAGKHAGTVGTIGCLSFNGNKIITAGGGGMILVNDGELAARARYLTTQAKIDGVRYVHGDVGYNYRLTNVLAAIGTAQLEQLPAILEIKRRNYDAYRRGLTGTDGLTLVEPPDYADNNLWMYAVRIDRDRYGRDREATMSALAGMGIETRPLWYPNHLQTMFTSYPTYRIERVSRLHAETLNIPCSTNLSPADIDTVVEALSR